MLAFKPAFRSITVGTPFTIGSLFLNGEQGAWYDPSDLATLFQDSAGTTPVTADGDPVGRAVDKSGNAVNATQATATARPTYRTGPARLTLDKVDDALVITVPAGGFVGTMVLSTVEGTAAYGINIPAGSHTIGRVYYPTAAGSAGGIVGIVMLDRAMTDAEVDGVSAYFVSRGGGPAGAAAYGGVTDLTNYYRQFPTLNTLTQMPLIDTSAATSVDSTWRDCGALTSFPLIDTSSVTDFRAAWFKVPLTSFPLLDTSSGTRFTDAWRETALVTFPLLNFSSSDNFQRTWQDTTSLTNFPANPFDNCLCTNFTDAFNNTNLSQTSIDNILVSINSNGTSGGTFDQSGGSAPSATGEAAITAMRSRGWTVTVTGGF